MLAVPWPAAQLTLTTVPSAPPSPSNSASLPPLYDEASVALELARTRMLPFFSNSFLAIAGKTAIHGADFDQQAYLVSSSRRALFRTRTQVLADGDSRLRVYVYHIPPIAVVGFTLPVIERLIKSYPQTVVGIKDSSGDWNNLKAILQAFPGFGIFTGSERFLLPTLRLGGVGTISAMANVIPGRIRRLYDNFLAALRKAGIKAADLVAQ